MRAKNSSEDVSKSIAFLSSDSEWWDSESS